MQVGVNKDVPYVTEHSHVQYFELKLITINTPEKQQAVILSSQFTNGEKIHGQWNESCLWFQ